MKLKRSQEQRGRITLSTRAVVFSGAVFLIAGFSLFIHLSIGESQDAHADDLDRGNSFITVKEFEAVRYGNVIRLGWITSGEMNNDYFTILRGTDPGLLQAIGKVDGAGASTMDIRYEFTDNNPINGNCFYQLIQTGLDGRVKEFKSIAVKPDTLVRESKLISLQPNPFIDQFKINYTSENPGLFEFVMTDISGKVIDRSSAIAGTGMNSVAFEGLQGLQKGVYFLYMIKDRGEPSVAKITKGN